MAIRKFFLSVLPLLFIVGISHAETGVSDFVDIEPATVLTAADQREIAGRAKDELTVWTLPIRLHERALLANGFSASLYDKRVQVKKRNYARLDRTNQQTWRGYVLLDGDGDFDQVTGMRAVTITRKLNGRIRGYFRIDQFLYSIESLRSGRYVLTKRDLSKIGLEMNDVVPSDKQTSHRSSKSVDRRGAEDVDVIRVVIGFTPAAEGGDQPAFFDKVETAFEMANEGYENSNIDLQLDIAAYARPNYVEASTGQAYQHLLQGSAGPLWLVHVAREGEQADVAVIVIASDVSGDVGLASLGSTAASALVAMKTNGLFSYTMPHEIGHLMGANHNPENIFAPSIFAYGHGFTKAKEPNVRFSKSYGTIMHSRPNFIRYNYWSTPLQTLPDGLPLGTAEIHDNARVVREMKSTIADYYPDPTANSPVKLYTPSGVSTVISR